MSVAVHNMPLSPPRIPTELPWAIVEVFGHARYAGEVAEVVRFGAVFARVYVPAWTRRLVEQEYGTLDGQRGWLERDVVEDYEAFEVDLGAGSIFSLREVSEAVARAELPSCNMASRSREMGAWRLATPVGYQPAELPEAATPTELVDQALAEGSHVVAKAAATLDPDFPW